MGQKAIGQSNCRIFTLNISPEQNPEKTRIFACSYKFMEIKSCLENIGVGIVKNGCGYSGFRTLKFGAFQEG